MPLGVAEAFSPLADSITAVGHLSDRCELVFGMPADGRWRSCAELLSDHSGFDRWRKHVAEWMLGEYGQAPKRTTDAYVRSWYLQVPAHAAAMLFHHKRRVPSLRPEHLAFRLAESRPRPDGVAVLAPDFVCLPDDPAAGRPEATVVRDEQALAAVLRARFAGHAARFVQAYGPTTRSGPRTLWGAATDALDVNLWRAGRNNGDEAAGVADAALTLPTKLAPFTSASTLRQTMGQTPNAKSSCADSGQPGWTRRKESCCFHYLLAEGDGECATCPRVQPKL